MSSADTAIRPNRPTQPAGHEAPAEVLGDLVRTEAPTDGRPPRRSIRRGGVVLVLVLLLQAGFIAAYIGALHSPTPDRLPVAVVSSDAGVSTIEAAQKKDDGKAVSAVAYPDGRAALDAVDQRKAYAALIPDGSGGTELRIASAGGTAAAQALVQAYGKAADAVGVPMTVYDNHPVGSSDSRGLSAFYLVVGWVVGGYLAAAALAIVAGSIPANSGRASLRVASLLAYSALSGIAGAVLAGPVLHIWDGNGVALAAFGSMVVFGAAITAAALQGWLGILGTGASIVLFVVLGNPGSGGPFSPELLPAFFRDMQGWVLPGVGTHLVRSIMYFGGTAIGGDLIALWVYGLGGAIAFLLAGTIKPGRFRAHLTGS